MYARSFSSSAEPAGLGPNSTCLRTCSKARSPSKSEAPFDDGLDVEGEEGLSSMGLLDVPLGQPNSSNGTNNKKAKVKYRDKRSDEGKERWSSVDIVIIVKSLVLVMLTARGSADRRTDRYTFFRCPFLVARFTATVGADSDHPQQVRSQLELVLCGHGVLESFEFGRVKLDDLAAVRADHVIVMLMFVVVFVMRPSIAEANLARQTRVSQQPECAIDRGLANRRVLFTHQTIKVLTGHVAFGVQKHVENKIALRRALETLLLDVLVKDFLLFGHRFSVGKQTLGTVALYHRSSQPKKYKSCRIAIANPQTTPPFAAFRVASSAYC